MGLVFGHFGHIGKISIVPNNATLKMLRELGLMMFLIGAGGPVERSSLNTLSRYISCTEQL